MPGFIPLLAMGAGVAAQIYGAGKATENIQNARNVMNKTYNDALTTLETMKYRDALNSPSNQSLLKLRDEQREENLDAMQNRAVAGGATAENQLAAMKNENRADSELYSRILLNEDARRTGLTQQEISLKQQHGSDLANSYAADANNWNQWGANTASGLMDFGSTGLFAASQGLSMKDLFSWKGKNGK